ncbi:MAG: hypothetical protein ABFE13_13100 [Phycisphaerales bacterium]
MSDLRRILAAAVSIWLLGSGAMCLPAAGRDAKLVLHPQKAPADVGKFSLLPPESAMIDGDALPLYEKAIQALPDKAGDDQIAKWLDVPLDQLPLDQVEQSLTQRMDSLKSVAKVVKCRQCNWPAWKPEMKSVNLQEYRRLALVIRLWARMEIADEGYEGAILAFQTGFGMARHLGQAPTTMQVLVGVAVGSVMSREVGEFVQREGAPNLVLALASMPRPFVDTEELIEMDRRNALAEWKDKMSSEQIESELKKSHDPIRLLVKGFDCDLAALQCVEAIRAYAAAHDGKLPMVLTDITEGSVPQDPMSGGPFRYSRTGLTAVLESTLPAGVAERRRIRYEISIQN